MISVIMCVHNGEPWLGHQLDSLSRQTFRGDWELVVVIDRCTDSSEATASSWADRLPLRLVAVKDGAGQAEARNVGARAARGEYLLFCDADDVAEEGWLEAMAGAADTTSFIGGHLEEESLNRSTIASWRYPLTQGGLPVAFGRWTVPVGANFGVSSLVLAEVGGFDPALPTGDEVDFAIRAQLVGHHVRFVPEAVIRYRHRNRLRPLIRQQYRYGLDNAELFHRYRSEGLEPSRPSEMSLAMWRGARGIPAAVFNTHKRGAWVRYVSYIAGQFVGGLRHQSFCIR